MWCKERGRKRKRRWIEVKNNEVFKNHCFFFNSTPLLLLKENNNKEKKRRKKNWNGPPALTFCLLWASITLCWLHITRPICHLVLVWYTDSQMRIYLLLPSLTCLLISILIIYKKKLWPSLRPIIIMVTFTTNSLCSLTTIYNCQKVSVLLNINQLSWCVN